MSARTSYNIVWLSDEHDCELCGNSYAEGYNIYREGDLVLSRVPIAHCYDGRDYEREGAYLDILHIEGIHVDQDWQVDDVEPEEEDY